MSSRGSTQDVPENWLFTSEVADTERTRQYKYRLIVMITFITGLLMWTYALIATFFVSGITLSAIGVSCSSVHLLSPLIYRWTKSMALAAYNMVTAGMIFQFSFAFFTGGFYSPTMIWFAVLPMIVGILTTKGHAIVWTLIATLGVLAMYGLHQAGLCPPNGLSDLGMMTTQFLISLGLISLIGGFTVFFIELSYFYHSRANAKSHLDP